MVVAGSSVCSEVALAHIMDKVGGHVQSTDRRRTCKLGSNETEDKIVIKYM
jgi:hypothetical protein